VDRLTRHELKSDKFVAEVGHTIEYVEGHRQQVIRYAGIAVAVIVVAAGIWYFTRSQAEGRQSTLASALRVYNAPIMPVSPNPDTLTYPTPEARAEAVKKAFGEVISKHAGSDEAASAAYMLGLLAADQNNLGEAEKQLRESVRNGGKDTVSLAKLSLADILNAQGKAPEAEKLLKELVDSPTVLVSKEQATISLASLYAKSNRLPEARKLLEPMRTQSGAAGRAAMTMLAELSQNP
jgi:predicted negative regulator of RcsB-dependent stress response